MDPEKTETVTLTAAAAALGMTQDECFEEFLKEDLRAGEVLMDIFAYAPSRLMLEYNNTVRRDLEDALEAKDAIGVIGSLHRAAQILQLSEF